MKSKITGGPTKYLFKARMLKKHDVSYFQCEETGFIQTEEPYWLEEAYSSAISKLDLGLASRNELLRDRVAKLLIKNFDYSQKFLDYAGGYGLFTRLMRDQGFNFYHTDPYCENIFAKYFDLSYIERNTNFELATAFEVFEHLKNPLEEICELLKFSSNILFSTKLQPKKALTNVSDWWYFVPEIGQHISFFTEDSLKYIAAKYHRHFYTDGVSLHLLTKTHFNNPLLIKRDPFFLRKIKKVLKRYEKKQYPFPNSLLQADWEFVRGKII